MAKDLFHHLVREALEAEGWMITHDPYIIDKKIMGAQMDIDLGLERIIGAEKGTEKIAIEVKSFLRPSLINEFHAVLGQYLNYLLGLAYTEPDRQLFLAIPEDAYTQLKQLKLFELSVEQYGIKIITFDTINATVTWKK